MKIEGYFTSIQFNKKIDNFKNTFVEFVDIIKYYKLN